MTPTSPATLPPQLMRTNCSQEGTPHECACGGRCGPCSSRASSGSSSCPWWVWAIGLGIVFLVLGDGEQVKARHAPVRRKRR